MMKKRWKNLLCPLLNLFCFFCLSVPLFGAEQSLVELTLPQAFPQVINDPKYEGFLDALLPKLVDMLYQKWCNQDHEAILKILRYLDQFDQNPKALEKLREYSADFATALGDHGIGNKRHHPTILLMGKNFLEDGGMEKLQEFFPFDRKIPQSKRIAHTDKIRSFLINTFSDRNYMEDRGQSVKLLTQRMIDLKAVSPTMLLSALIEDLNRMYSLSLGLKKNSKLRDAFNAIVDQGIDWDHIDDVISPLFYFRKDWKERLQMIQRILPNPEEFAQKALKHSSRKVKKRLVRALDRNLYNQRFGGHYEYVRYLLKMGANPFRHIKVWGKRTSFLNHFKQRRDEVCIASPKRKREIRNFNKQICIMESEYLECFEKYKKYESKKVPLWYRIWDPYFR